MRTFGWESGAKVPCELSAAEPEGRDLRRGEKAKKRENDY